MSKTTIKIEVFEGDVLVMSADVTKEELVKATFEIFNYLKMPIQKLELGI